MAQSISGAYSGWNSAIVAGVEDAEDDLFDVVGQAVVGGQDAVEIGGDRARAACRARRGAARASRGNAARIMREAIGVVLAPCSARRR